MLRNARYNDLIEQTASLLRVPAEQIRGLFLPALLDMVKGKGLWELEDLISNELEILHVVLLPDDCLPPEVRLRSLLRSSDFSRYGK